MSNWSDEETDEPLIADHRNFYKVEKWSRDGQRHEPWPLQCKKDRPTPITATIIAAAAAKKVHRR
jgi:hypothetical protein